MVACYKPKNLKDLVNPTRMKDCNEVDLKASAYAEKHVGKQMGVPVKDRVCKIVSDDEVSTGMRERLHETFNLVGQETYYNSRKKKFVINARSTNDDDNRSQEQKNKRSMSSCSFKGKQP